MSRRRIVIELSGTESLHYKGRAVIEVPADVSVGEVQDLSGHEIQELMAEADDGGIEWEVNFSCGILAEDEFLIGEDDMTSPNLRFVRDEDDGHLVCVTNVVETSDVQE
jgi:hypothetical protein